MLEDDTGMLLLTVTENGYGKRTAIDKTVSKDAVGRA